MAGQKLLHFCVHGLLSILLAPSRNTSVKASDAGIGIPGFFNSLTVFVPTASPYILRHTIDDRWRPSEIRRSPHSLHTQQLIITRKAEPQYCALVAEKSFDREEDGNELYRSAGHESQGHAVDAVPETGGSRPILKHVALVALTSRTMHFRSGHEEFEIGSRLDHAWIDRLPEAGPTGTAVELMLG